MTELPLAELHIERIHPQARLPVQAHPGDLGLDLSTVCDTTLAPGERCAAPTGLIIHFPSGWGAYIKDRSSLAMRGLHCLAGVIDAGYRGEIKVLIINLGSETQTLRSGDRIAQLIPTPTRAWTVTELSPTADHARVTDRGAGGFGSTGR